MTDVKFIELACDNFMLAQEVTGLGKGAFGKAVGLTSSQMSNIKSYRNPPPATAIKRACDTFGFTTDFFYRDELAGMRDPTLAGKILKARETTREKAITKRARRRLPA